MQTSAGEVELSLYNEIYVHNDYSLNPSFRKAAVHSFSSNIESIDFSNPVQCANKINMDVKNATHGKISNIISSDSLGELTRIVIINAIYFRANWKHKFNRNCTHQGKFHAANLKKEKAEFMTLVEYFAFANLDNLNAKAVEMPYANSNLSCLLILPNKRDGLNTVEKGLKNDQWKYLFEKLKIKYVNVTIPKIKAQFTTDLKQPLTNVRLPVKIVIIFLNLSCCINLLKFIF